jgi:hypothetical protein
MDDTFSLSNTCHNVCTICLCPLLVHPPQTSVDDDDNSADDASQSWPDEGCGQEIGAVWPCGHCYHIACFMKWRGEGRCPTCNQPADLFSKLYISAPPLPPMPNKEPKVDPPVQISLVAVPHDDKDDEDEQRQILLDMRTAEQAEHADLVRRTVSQNARIRKMQRALDDTALEFKSTKVVLDITQEELDLANEELKGQKEKVGGLQGKLARIQTQHWQRHQIFHDELVDKHNAEVAALRQELNIVRSQLAARNRQLAHWTGQTSVNPPIPVLTGHRVETAPVGDAIRVLGTF